ncbi:MAG: Ig-like domain-containing protein, partial [Ignavibacteria bacterium]|nr:Ig-like domain-containing protein [Ignavibacteria bacterium]
VSLNGQIDTTDTYESLFNLYSNDPNQLHNGFYFFEDLPAGTYPITVSAEGFDPYAGNVTIEDTFFTFKDIQMVSNVPPFITSILPEQNDSLYPGNENIRIIFSRPMNKASVESTLVISPSVQVNFIWSDLDRKLAITTTNFNFNTNYQLTVSGNAMDKYNHLFDGDGNGTGGDDFVLNFKTKVQDFSAPVIVDVYPLSNETGVEIKPIINLSFNEQINTSTLSGKVKLIRDSDQSNVSGILKHYIVDERSVVNLFVTNQLTVNESYTIILEPGLKDIFGNEITSQFTSGFTTGDQQFTVVSNIDNFESGIGNWWAPQQSGSTAGIITELTGISSALNYFNYIAGGSKSMKLTYGWDTLASSWLIREYYSLTTPSFNSSNILQTYLFGDGTGNKFRFSVRDNGGFEVSPWYSMNWIGWKLINWDMTNDGTGTWIGNGVLNDPLRFDSYQLTFEPGNDNTGEVYFDDLRIVNKTTVGVVDEIISGIPSDYILEQNYPNPFNPITQIRFGIPEAGFVKLEVYNLLGQKIVTLIDEEMSSGYHSVDFSAKDGSASGGNGKDLSSGIYVYTLSVNDFVTSKKMILLK